MRLGTTYPILSGNVILEPFFGENLVMKDRITIDPNIHFGKPCVNRTRIPVLSVLELVKEGVSFQQISQDYYPDLELDDIRACLQYAIEILNVEDLHITTQA